jgi:hypothetical protein
MNVVVGFARDKEGHGFFALKAGETKARSPSLAGAVLAALDQVGFHDGR